MAHRIAVVFTLPPASTASDSKRATRKKRRHRERREVHFATFAGFVTVDSTLESTSQRGKAPTLFPASFLPLHQSTRRVCHFECRYKSCALDVVIAAGEEMSDRELQQMLHALVDSLAELPKTVEQVKAKYVSIFSCRSVKFVGVVPFASTLPAAIRLTVSLPQPRICVAYARAGGSAGR